MMDGSAYVPLTKPESDAVNAANKGVDWYHAGNYTPPPGYTDANANALLATKNYSVGGHLHDDRYAQSGHGHSEYSPSSHSHTF
jgi:hypothetical protein